MSSSNQRSKPRHPSLHIHDMPSEVIRQIFIATYPLSIFEPESDVSPAESIQLPCHLSHVCRRWRDEALSFGELWSYLYLTEEEVKRDHQMALEIFFAFLERSNVSPLNFRFQYHIPRYESEVPPPFDNEEELSTIETIISVLLDNQDRWQTVDFTWRGFRVSPNFRKIEISSIPLLKNLSLKVKLHGHDSEVLWPLINIIHSPRLESFDLWGMQRLMITTEFSNYGILKCRLSQNFPISFNQAAKYCSCLLKFAPNLQSLVYNNIDGYDDGTYDLEPPERHSLKELYLLEGYSADQLLDSVDLPELEKLDCYGVSISQGRKVLDMIRRSRPPLTLLRLSRIPCDTLLQILSLLPTLLELSFGISSDEDAVTRALAVQSTTHNGRDRDQTVLCPRLRDLFVHVSTPWRGEVSEETAGRHTNALFAMLDSRMMNFGTFNKVSIVLDILRDCYRTEPSSESRDHNVVKEVFKVGGELIIETST